MTSGSPAMPSPASAAQRQASALLKRIRPATATTTGPASEPAKRQSCGSRQLLSMMQSCPARPAGQIRRPGRGAAPGKIPGRRDDQHSRRAEPARDQVRGLTRTGAHPPCGGGETAGLHHRDEHPVKVGAVHAGGPFAIGSGGARHGRAAPACEAMPRHRPALDQGGASVAP
jgi:hypothetical protein